MIPTYHLFVEEIPLSVIKSAVKQAAVWGTGGILASKLGQSKEKHLMSKKEKKKEGKKALIQGLAGAATGAAGALV